MYYKVEIQRHYVHQIHAICKCHICIETLKCKTLDIFTFISTDSAWQLKLECTRTEFQSEIGRGYILSTHEEVALRMRETTTSFFAVLGG